MAMANQGSTAPKGVKLEGTTLWQAKREQLRAAVRQQVQRPVDQQNPTQIMQMCIEAWNSHTGSRAVAREHLLEDWRGVEPGNVLGWPNADVRKMRLEAGLDPEKGILPVADAPVANAGPSEGRRAHVVALYVAERGRWGAQSRIAQRLGIERQTVNGYIRDYLSD